MANKTKTLLYISLPDEPLKKHSIIQQKLQLFLGEGPVEDDARVTSSMEKEQT